MLTTFLLILLVLTAVYTLTPPEKRFEWGVATERKIAGLSLKHTTISEGSITYLEGGKGTPLLLLHGFGADKDNWVRMAKHLTKKYRVIAPDLPGFGESFKHTELDYDVTSQVARLSEFADKLGLTQFHIGGNSMGGYIAANYAVTCPDHIECLWLLNPLGIASSPDSEMFAMVKEKKRPPVLAGNVEQYQALVAFVFHNRPFIPGFIIEELAKRAEASFPLNSKIFQDIHHIDDDGVHFAAPLDEVLKGFDKPLLITWGDKDRVLHPKGAKILSAIVPSASVEMMHDMGHLPMIEKPASTAQQFIQFDQA
ncbi:alpha/beta fold hydrolase [Grimontia marina]|uniref:Lipase 1 n=1 Tax=Grimontia marina TaxID=646534 RepID=A0A128FHK7_9GAMM|nr:alpha/beta hydrolase [Grimontia marina]CZF86282.1 Lipase 1 precursor [Grimontia marina]